MTTPRKLVTNRYGRVATPAELAKRARMLAEVTHWRGVTLTNVDRSELAGAILALGGKVNPARARGDARGTQRRRLGERVACRSGSHRWRAKL